MRQMRRRSVSSDQLKAEAITTAAARAASGRSCSRPGRHEQHEAHRQRPSHHASPAVTGGAAGGLATGVLDALALTGPALERPAARLAAPRPTISLVGIGLVGSRCARRCATRWCRQTDQRPARPSAPAAEVRDAHQGQRETGGPAAA